MEVKKTIQMSLDILKNAEPEVYKSGLSRMLVIDADVHHLTVIPYLSPYMDQPWRHIIESAGPGLTQSNIGNRFVASRIKRTFSEWPSLKEKNRPPLQIKSLVADLTRMGIDYSVVFPNDLLDLGFHPQSDFEVAVAQAYARWITEQVLPHEPRVWSLLYLPFSDPDASLKIIEEFGENPGVVGFLITGNRNEKIHHNKWIPIYSALNERKLTLGFHSTGYWAERPYRMFDSFMTAHALSFPMYNSIHLVNLVLGGIAERFPELRIVFFEAGASVLPMLMSRLDTAFMMRPSEAPLLQRLPSEYIKKFYFTVQPIENPDKLNQLQAILDTIGRSQILYASDYPHWDCDMPSSITDIGFLSQKDRENIFCYNALRAFRVPRENLSRTDWKKSMDTGN